MSNVADFWSDSFVIFEFSLMLGAPLVILGSLIADVVLLARGRWRVTFAIVAVLNAAALLLWFAAVGQRLFAVGGAALAWVGGLAVTALLLPALFVLPLVNLVVFVAYVLTSRGSKKASAAEPSPLAPAADA